MVTRGSQQWEQSVQRKEIHKPSDVAVNNVEDILGLLSIRYKPIDMVVLKTAGIKTGADEKVAKKQDPFSRKNRKK